MHLYCSLVLLARRTGGVVQTRTKHIWGALLLGALAVLPTAVIGLVAALPLALVSALYFMHATWAFQAGIVLFALVGAAIATIISYLSFRSWSLAALTLGAAFMTQGILVAYWSGVEKRDAAHARAEWAALEDGLNRTVRKFAALGIARYEVSEPLDRSRDNHHPELGPIYGKLTFKVPVTVHVAGVYHLRVRYRTGPYPTEFRAGPLESIDSLAVGRHEIRVQFALGEEDYPGLWSPASVGGRATAELFLKVDQTKLLRSFVPDTEELARLRLRLIKQAKSGSGIVYWRELRVDSTVTEFSGGARYPSTSQWGRAPASSHLTDKQEGVIR